MVYGVFIVFFGDWVLVGYFPTRLEAEKYCALKNKQQGYADYHVKELKDLTNTEDLSNVLLKYKHEVRFDIVFNSKNKRYEYTMSNEPTRYDAYIDNNLQQNFVRWSEYRGHGWVVFTVNIDTGNCKQAEKIAQDYLVALLRMGHGKITQRNIGIMNKMFAK